MRNFASIKRLLMATALILSPTVAYAQAAQTAAPTPAATAPATQKADPALWVIKDADTTIYLFGTVHLLKPGLNWFDSAVKNAFDKSDEIVLELIDSDASESQAMIARYAIDMTGPALQTKLSPAAREKLALAAKDLGGPVELFDRFKPWFAGIMVGMAPLGKLGYSPNSGVEKVISAAAQAANKKIIGLETGAQQLSFFDSLSEPMQIAFLTDSLASYENAGAMLDKMVGQWAAGDPEGLGNTINESLRKHPELAKVLLADRNERWAAWIKNRLETPGTVFVAVGAGHLTGDDSVQAYLKNHKIKTLRIDY